MKKIILFVLAISSFTIHSTAQSKKESIKVLFKLMQQDSIVKKTFDVMTSSMIASVATEMNDSADQKMQAKIMAKSMEASQKIAMKMINEDLVDIYDKYFTQEEINDFIVFFKSKSGQKMVSRSTDIQKDVMQIMTAKYTPDIQAEVLKEINKIMKDN